MPTALSPSSVMVRAAAAIFSGLRLKTATLAPARAKCWAMPRLMPLEAPATTQTLPASTWSLKASCIVLAPWPSAIAPTDSD